jgi:CubicO group peptidase (beta-lactamase class C family)
LKQNESGCCRRLLFQKLPFFRAIDHRASVPRRLAVVAIALAVALIAPPVHAGGRDPHDSTSAPSSNDAWPDPEVRRLGHPGVAVGIVGPNGLLLSRGYGVRNRRTGGAVDERTVFRLASITKVFSGLALLALRDDGAFAMDDPVSKVLPEIERITTPFRHAPPITFRNLVTHTSGLPRDLPGGMVPSERAFLGLLARTRADAPAGARTQYSNFAMGLVGPAVHRASGQSFRDFVQARILGPLTMTQTVWERRDVDPAHLAWGHTKNKDTNQFDPEPSEWRIGAAEAFGGLYSSVEDLSKLVALELSAWSGEGDDRGPIHRASLRESQLPALPSQSGPLRYGIPWVLTEDPELGPRVEHTGATDEYSASVSFYPRRGVGVIVLSNAPAPADVEALARRLLKRAALRPPAQ